MPNDFELDPMVESTPDNDGAVPLNSGYEVLGRILAQAGPVKYTKALLDSGDLPEGTVIEELTGPIQEAGEGMIAKVENTGTGEATVTVQATSIGVAVGFPCKGVVLYVEDPDTGADVAYTYLDLHEHPSWIRASGGATNSLVTFEIQSIISSATSVQAIINPNALARIVDLEDYALIGHSHEYELIETIDLPREELRTFADSVMERFTNPFVDHQVTSIMLNAFPKFATRDLPGLKEYLRRKGTLPSGIVFGLAALITYYKGGNREDGTPIVPSDSPDIMEHVARLWQEGDEQKVASGVLERTDWWGEDLNRIPGLTERLAYYLKDIRLQGMRGALKHTLDS